VGSVKNRPWDDMTHRIRDTAESHISGEEMARNRAGALGAIKGNKGKNTSKSTRIQWFCLIKVSGVVKEQVKKDESVLPSFQQRKS